MGVPAGASQVEVTFTAAGKGTTLLLVHRGLGAHARPLHDDGWTRFLDRLVAVVEGRASAPYPTETPQERRRWLSTS